MRQYIIDFKKAYDAVIREVLHNSLIEIRVSIKLIQLIKMCVNETYSKAHIGKYFSGSGTKFHRQMAFAQSV
jgi:hypothetical protein